MHDFQNEVSSYEKFTGKGIGFSKWGEDVLNLCIKVHNLQNEVQNFENQCVNVYNFQKQAYIDSFKVFTLKGQRFWKIHA